MTPVDEGEPRIGLNVRAARRSRGMSLETLAGLTGRSKGWLSKIENGHSRLERRQDIAAIAEALEVSADSLVGEPAPEIQRHGQQYNFRPLRAALLDATIDHPRDMPARPVTVLAELTADQDAALRRADYTTLTQQLPGLLDELQVHAMAPASADRDIALRLLIQACASAMLTLRHFGLSDLAWVSADRGLRAADLLGDPVWHAAAAFQCAHARVSASKSRALLSSARRADTLQPHIGDDPFAHEVYGMLHLSAALACAVQGDHDGSRAHGTEAAEMAARLGERPDAFELFGPANADVWRASFAVEAGNAGEALAYADAIEPRELASGNRRAALRLEKARAYAMLGRDADAVREMRQAERLSPAQVRHHPLIRELATDMLSRARRETGGRDLRGLAWRMNII
ncbi:MAG: helix-turn-helix domain-containing protein [Actinomycetota bacterium]|nr:helix-turn-helix domain-containing protein [Actinomycetota bacterium]